MKANLQYKRGWNDQQILDVLSVSV